MLELMIMFASCKCNDLVLFFTLSKAVGRWEQYCQCKAGFLFWKEMSGRGEKHLTYGERMYRNWYVYSEWLRHVCWL